MTGIGRTWPLEVCRTRNANEKFVQIVVDVQQVTEPTDRQRIFSRLMRLTEDYDMVRTTVESKPDEIVLRVRIPDFDMSELRAVQYNQQETGFITADELMRLQKAGSNRPIDIPPRRMPRNRRRFKERARQKIFQREPRSI